MKTTIKHFKLFRVTCGEWQKKLGLTQYEFVFFHNDEEPESRSWADVNKDGMLARVGLTLNWKKSPHHIDDFDLEIKKCAFHEVWEVALWPIRVLLRQFFDEELVNSVIHDIIRRLENLFFP